MTHEPTPPRSEPLRLTKTLIIPGRRCWKETLWAHRRKSSTRRGESRWHGMSTCIVVDPASPANGGGGARYGAVSTYVDVSSPMRTSYWSVSGWYFHTRASSPFSFCPKRSRRNRRAPVEVGLKILTQEAARRVDGRGPAPPPVRGGPGGRRVAPHGADDARAHGGDVVRPRAPAAAPARRREVAREPADLCGDQIFNPTLM